MNSTLLILSTLGIVITAGAHSILGETRLIAPTIALRCGPMAADLGRQVLRCAWHFTSLLMAVAAVVLVDAVLHPATARPILVGTIGAVFVGAGLFDAIVTRGKHLGWPLLLFSGVMALMALA